MEISLCHTGAVILDVISWEIEHHFHPRDIGFSCWAVDASRCRKSPVNVEATFMGEAVLDLPFCSNVIYFHDMVNFVVVCSQLWNSDDLLYLKEQMEAEEDAERLLRRTEKQAFAAFKISSWERAACVDI
ncbi:hypothetical protein B296_00039369 [Ensete ventricosum]|uniref:Uncharacterized protein n=1 Tax=Ensete ventricosum TaxID=4639 RepID=A0A426YLI1_ENSVE|nr:hypothetical protein B296_00039369 [Ensete ventricosum]